MGVDLIPYKYCPLNCVYCEVQRTTHLTLQRQEFFPVEDIIAELKDALRDRPKLDYVTFSGAGEPTLYSKIGDILRFIKTNYPEYKVALITNSILLTDPIVRSEVLTVDIAMPSLDAVSPDVFEQINRPAKGIAPQDVIDGLVEYRREFSGEMWLEVFIITGVNDHAEELQKLCEAIGQIQPDRVQINSLDRPGTEDWVQAAKLETLEYIRDYFQQRLCSSVEIIAKVSYDRQAEHLDDEVVELIKSILIRRPCTAEDLSSILDLHINEVSKVLRQLHLESIVDVHRENRGVFYAWKS